MHLQTEPQKPFSSACQMCKMPCRTDIACQSGWIYKRIENDAVDTAFRCKQFAAVLKSQKSAQGLSGAGLNDAEFASGWDNLELEHKSWRMAIKISNNLEKVVQQGLHFVFSGEPGRGKTHAAMLICRDALEAGYSVLRIDWSEFLDGLRDGYSDKTIETENAKFKRLVEVQLLLIDDIGSAGENKEFSQARLEKLIMRRHHAGRPTIMTANFSLSSLEQLVGERASSRIRQRAVEINFNGKNYRDPLYQRQTEDLIDHLWSGL